MSDTTEPLLTINEVADATRMSVRTMRRAAQRGDLRAVRFGRSVRVRTSDLADFIDRHIVQLDRTTND